MYYLIFFLWRKLNQSQLGMDGWLKKLNLKNLIMQKSSSTDDDNGRSGGLQVGENKINSEN